jgi:hypothetical protein
MGPGSTCEHAHTSQHDMLVSANGFSSFVKAVSAALWRLTCALGGGVSRIPSAFVN